MAKVSVVDVVSRTCTIFAILGLGTICLAMLVNGLIIWMSVLNPPTPVIKSLVVRGLSEGSARISVDMEFPPQPFADVFNLKTDGSTHVSLGIETAKQPGLVQNLASIYIDEGIKVNLASSKPTRVILNDIQLHLHEINPKLVSEIIDLEKGEIVMPKSLQAFVNTRVITDTLLLPFGATLKLPINISLDKKTNKDKDKKESKQADEASSESQQQQQQQQSKEEGLSEETKKFISNFLPKRVQLSSTPDQFVVEIQESIPVSALPPFLAVEVPQMKFSLAFKNLKKAEDSKAEQLSKPVLTFEIDDFVIGKPDNFIIDAADGGEHQGAASSAILPSKTSSTAQEERVDFKARISVLSNLLELARLARDDELKEVEFSAGVDEAFASKAHDGSLMKWLSGASIRGTLKQFKDLQGNMAKKENKKKEEEEGEDLEEQQKPQEKPTKVEPNNSESDYIMKTLFENIKVKLVHLRNELVPLAVEDSHETDEKDKEGPLSVDGDKTSLQNSSSSKATLQSKSTIELRIRILRKRIIKKLGLSPELFIGQIPTVEFTVSKAGTGREKFSKIAAFRFESNPISKRQKRTDLTFKFSIFHSPPPPPHTETNVDKDASNAKQENIILTELEMAKSLYKRLHDEYKDLLDIERLRIEFTPENVFTKVMRVMDCDIYLTPERKMTKLRFVGTKREIEFKTTKAPEETTDSAIEKAVSYARTQLKAAMVVRNEPSAAVIAARITPPIKPAGSSPMRLFTSWSEFHFDVLLNEQKLMQFAVLPGHLIIGLKDHVGPVDGGFKFELRIPTNTNSLAAFKKVVETLQTPGLVPKLEDKLVFKARFGSGGNSFRQELSLAFLKAFNDGTYKMADVTGQASEKKTETTTNQSAEAEAADGKQTTKPSLLGELANSVLQVISFQAPTFFFHINIPEKTYCTEKEMTDFNWKLTADIALPVVQARLCATEVASKRVNCLIRAGISRPVILTTDIVDGNLCFATFKVLPPAEKLATFDEIEAKSRRHKETIIGFSAIQSITKYDFKPNEFPIHASIDRVADVIRFSENLGAKEPQVLSLALWDGASAFEKVLGEVGSSVVRVELPAPLKSADEVKEKAKVAEEQKKNTPTKVIQVNKDKPAVLDLEIKSASANSINMFVSLGMPSFSMAGLETALNKQNLYRWTVLRWGLLNYKLFIPGVFDVSFALTPGEVDLKPEGVVLVGEKDTFKLQIKVNVNDKIHFGSSALRQLIGMFQRYLKTSPDKRHEMFPSVFFDYLKTEHINYEMKTGGSHGQDDEQIFAVQGQFPIQSLFNLIESIWTQETGKPAATTKVGDEATKKVVESQSSAFDKMLISLTTLPSKIRIEPHLNVPCLIPSMCHERENPSVSSSSQDEINLYLEIKNLLKPATALASTGIAKALQALYFAKYPSHFELKVRSLDDLRMTFMLNGVGLASIGLPEFEFKRVTKLVYPSTDDVVLEEAPEQAAASQELQKIKEEGKAPVAKHGKDEDVFALKLAFAIAETVKKSSPSFNTVRMNYLTNAFTVAPALFDKDADGGIKRVKLVNPAFNIGFGNDALINHRTSNLLASLLTALNRELVFPGFNFPDPEELSNAGKEMEDPSSTGMSIEWFNKGTIATSALANFAKCMIASSCNFDTDVKFVASLPLAKDSAVSFDLPDKTTVSLYYKDLPFLQVVLVPETATGGRMNISKGINKILGHISFNFHGANNIRVPDTSTPKELIDNVLNFSVSGKENVGVPVRLRIEIGNDADLNVEAELPLNKLKYQLYRYINQFEWLKSFGIYKRKVPVDDDVVLETRPSSGKESIKTNDIGRMVEKLDPMQRECIDGEASSSNERRYRLATLELANTALFLEEGKDAIEPFTDTNVYLQLMNWENLPVCGLPSKLENLKVSFVRYASGQPDVRLISLFSCPAPLEEESFTFDTEFIDHASLFKAKINLPYSGTYQVRFHFGPDKGRQVADISELAIYVRQAGL